MNFHARYAMNPDAVENGTWVEMGDGLAVKVRRGNSAAAKAKRKELEEPYRAARKFNQELSTKENEEIMIKMMAECLVVSWRGVLVTDPDDPESSVEVPFSPETAEEYFRKYPDFREDVATIIFDRDTFRAAATEEDAKNS